MRSISGTIAIRWTTRNQFDIQGRSSFVYVVLVASTLARAVPISLIIKLVMTFKEKNMKRSSWWHVYPESGKTSSLRKNRSHGRNDWPSPWQKQQNAVSQPIKGRTAADSSRHNCGAPGMTMTSVAGCAVKGSPGRRKQRMD